MNKKWINSTLNCEAYSSFEGVSSDPRFIAIKICLSLCRNKKLTAKASNNDRSSLSKSDISNVRSEDRRGGEEGCG